MNIVERIIALVQEKNISLHDFADLMGATDWDISEWRRGNYNPTLIQIVKMSEYLNVSCDYLLTGEISKEAVVKCPYCDRTVIVKIPPVRDKII